MPSAHSRQSIDVALRARDAEVTVHNLKDLPAELPDGLVLAVYPEREAPHDVLVTRRDTVLVLRDVEGLSHGEIGKALEISVSNVKTRVHRARLFLRKRLADYMASVPLVGKHERSAWPSAGVPRDTTMPAPPAPLRLTAALGGRVTDRGPLPSQ